MRPAFFKFSILNSQFSIPSEPRRVLGVDALGDDVDELVEIEWLEDGVADGIVRNFVDAAFAGGGEDDDVGTIARISLHHLFDEFISVEPGHHEVEKDEIE